MKFKDWLRRELKKQGLTRQEFADMVGVSLGCVELWLSGKTLPKFDKLQSCAKALGYVVKLEKRKK